MDASSRARLQAVPDTARVLLSLRVDPLPETPLSLEGGREVFRTANAVLVEVPRAGLSRLGSIAGVKQVAVWGGADAAGKLGPRLRRQLLEAWASASEEPLPMIASFAPEHSGDLKAEVEAVGAHPRTVAGSVVTLDAAPEAVFGLLQVPDLLRLQKPRPTEPLGAK